MKTKNKTGKTRCAETGAQHEPEVLNILREQNELLGVIIGLLRKVVNSEAEQSRRPRRSKDQLRQLALAYETLKADPQHNVRRAAQYAFRKTAGYKTVHTLELALHKMWNCRMA